jgi:hypothetical protein
MTTERALLRAGGWMLRWGLLTLAPALQAAEAPEPPVEAQATYQVIQPQGLPSRLLIGQPSAVRSLDPAIFIELSPVTASEPAVRLLEDQRDDD